MEVYKLMAKMLTIEVTTLVSGVNSKPAINPVVIDPAKINNTAFKNRPIPPVARTLEMAPIINTAEGNSLKEMTVIHAPQTKASKDMLMYSALFGSRLFLPIM